jgi:hypothetical protein
VPSLRMCRIRFEAAWAHSRGGHPREARIGEERHSRQAGRRDARRRPMPPENAACTRSPQGGELERRRDERRMRQKADVSKNQPRNRHRLRTSPAPASSSFPRTPHRPKRKLNAPTDKPLSSGAQYSTSHLFICISLHSKVLKPGTYTVKRRVPSHLPASISTQSAGDRTSLWTSPTSIASAICRSSFTGRPPEPIPSATGQIRRQGISAPYTRPDPPKGPQISMETFFNRRFHAIRTIPARDSVSSFRGTIPIVALHSMTKT